ncbi:hypothetical protein IAI18_21890 [Acetobacteraceae bacterium H6797]|nr:hypothetical protein [Acetobacteraceae bacterium H6797]
MARYGIEDLQINTLRDLVRANPRMYIGGEPQGLFLASNLSGELLFRGCKAVQVERACNWWKVTADTDWFRDEAGRISSDAFTVLRFPERGLNAIRSEPVIAAIADAVVTIGADGVKWIVGNETAWPTPAAFSPLPASLEPGRCLIFHLAT